MQRPTDQQCREFTEAYLAKEETLAAKKMATYAHEEKMTAFNDVLYSLRGLPRNSERKAERRGILLHANETAGVVKKADPNGY